MTELPNNTSNVWEKHKNTYHPGNTAAQTRLMGPGVYRFVLTPHGWYLECTSRRFEFPFKVYGNHDHITDRIRRAWGALDANLGVLLNGLKGTGKTVTAQRVANWAIDQGIPVLVVTNPIPLTQVLERIEQPVVIIFDEFEKTHRQEEEQQALLTALDGMARNSHKRLFLFATNSKAVEDNFLDRPSRIRYLWEFGRLSEDVIEELLDDILDPELSEMRAEIITYLNTRKVLSIDVAKTVIQEVNTFREAPTEFENMMNLSEQDARGFTLEFVNEEGDVLRTLSHYFKPRRNDANLLRGCLTKSGQKAYVENQLADSLTYTFYDDGFRDTTIELVEATDDPSIWVCHVKVPIFDTWVKNFREVEGAWACDNALWIDVKPEEWKIPNWAYKTQRKEELTEEELTEASEWGDSHSVFGTGVRNLVRVLIKITQNFDTYSSQRHNSMVGPNKVVANPDF